MRTPVFEIQRLVSIQALCVLLPYHTSIRSGGRKEGGVVEIGPLMGAWSTALTLLSLEAQSLRRGVDLWLEYCAGAFVPYLPNVAGVSWELNGRVESKWKNQSPANVVSNNERS